MLRFEPPVQFADERDGRKAWAVTYWKPYPCRQEFATLEAAAEFIARQLAHEDER